MTGGALVAYGWDEHWAARLAEHGAGGTPGRVVRHDGVSVEVATADRTRTGTLRRTLEPAPVVGDWVELDGSRVERVLPRASLLVRRSLDGNDAQAMAANVDVVLLVCGADRPLRHGRLQRGAALARESGAVPRIVLTKVALHPEPAGLLAEVTEAHPDLEVVVTSVREGVGLDDLRATIGQDTVVLLGESGAGKSSLVNALLGEVVAETKEVRRGDAKGRHTTTARTLHRLPDGGCLIDTPGIREVGLWGDPDAVDATFPEIDELAEGCRFGDCRHDDEPGCAVTAAVAEGELDADRLAAWRRLRDELAEAAERATERERRMGEGRPGGRRGPKPPRRGTGPRPTRPGP